MFLKNITNYFLYTKEEGKVKTSTTNKKGKIKFKTLEKNSNHMKKRRRRTILNHFFYFQR